MTDVQLVDGEAPAAGLPGDAGGPAPIRVRNLTKQYGSIRAVDDLNLEIRSGEIFGLLGQNGAGKTTTILMLLGLTEPTSGKARVLGMDPARQPLDVKRQVGYLPDAVGFYGDLTGRQNLRYTAALNGIRRADAEVRIDTVLEQVGMRDRGDDRTDTYSRGMLQRLGIADALLKEPKVLILDEPTTSIDPIGVIEILDLLRTLSREQGITILLSSHLLNQVQSICDRVGIFAAGHLIGVGTVDELAGRFADHAAQIQVEFEAQAGEQGSAVADHAERVLGKIDGVTDVERGSGPRPWIVTVAPIDIEARVRRAIGEACASEHLPLLALQPVRPTLEDIYRRAVSRQKRAVA